MFFKAQPNRLRGRKGRPTTSFGNKREKDFIHSLLCFQETCPDTSLPIHQEKCRKCKHGQDGASKGDGPALLWLQFLLSQPLFWAISVSQSPFYWNSSQAGKSRAARCLPSAICLCEISRSHLLLFPRNVLYTQKEDTAVRAGQS